MTSVEVRGLIGRRSVTFLAAIVVIILAIGPLTFISPYGLSVIFFLLTFASLAQSYDIVGGLTGYINLGHIAFFAVGVYSFGALMNAGLGPALSFILAIPVVALFAAAVSIPFLRLRGFYFAVAMLALVGLLDLIVRSTALTSITGGFSGIKIATQNNQLPSYYLALALTVITTVSVYLIRKSKFGRGLLSIREDEQIAEVWGVNTALYKRLALIISAIFAGFAGEVYLWFLTITTPRALFGLDITFRPITIALLGGTGSVIGPLIGSALFAIIDQGLIAQVSYFSRGVIGIIFLLVGLAAPGGIVGLAKTKIARRLVIRKPALVVTGKPEKS